MQFVLRYTKRGASSTESQPFEIKAHNSSNP